jgi:hypothetical protein
MCAIVMCAIVMCVIDVRNYCICGRFKDTLAEMAGKDENGQLIRRRTPEFAGLFGVSR